MTAMQERTWLAVCPLESVPLGAGVAALLPDGAQVAIFRADDRVYALSNVDPFSGAAVLSRGIVGDRGGVPVVASPMHKQCFELATGQCLDDPEVRVAAYPVRVADGTVEVGGP
ncbi:nitrite reductase small subunit NirD [Amycolatopsis sp. 195334CR]|uniref:nitrite reductase small subunit NirD n=1 Tax=Amycolatopsis sp. 195334CR TaxID=2814588 RepID=UPI001A8ECD0B|nr:nitrite reductase small subunit NirD [Amycolatopsis sp. 195334CR]MBN6036754.1 nitrite reductase small subunit NirD [Amycolatopsis sp. 195334CR]